MHPAFSVIFFTTASGAGYGLLALLGLGFAAGLVPMDRGFAIPALGIGAALVSAGLLSSTAHLGRPERSWRAFSQWKTSWLSREGIAAIVTFGPLALLAFDWIIMGSNAWPARIVALILALMCVLTVYATGMIYRVLKPIHQWHNAWVVPNYLALALMTGAFAAHALWRLWGLPSGLPGVVAILAAGLAAWLKQAYWRFIDTTQSASSPESATALGSLGKVRLLESPHTEENYLLKEMGYRVARKHAARLRVIALALGFALPAALTLLALLTPAAIALPASLLAAATAAVGVLVERWLFFAEAKHTVTLYYGAVAA